MLIRSVDLETTGTPTDEDPQAICEAGWTDINVKLGDPVPSAVIVEHGRPNSLLVYPGRPMPADARAVHHLSDTELALGVQPGTACMKLMEGRPDYFCAHNADFEQQFFGGGDIPWICTYKVALRVFPDAPSHSLQFLRYHLDLEIDQAAGLPAHRAGPDAYVGAALMARLLEEPGAPDLDTMVRWSKGPALLTNVTFGKHKGMKWADLPTDYLRWIVDKSDMDRDTKANAKHHLKQKGAM